MSGLVDYSSSQEDDDDDPQQRLDPESANARPSSPSITSGSNNTTSLPPLPSSFRTLYATNVRSSNSDNPELHGGRKRQVAHVPGNWPSHVHTEWSPTRSQLPILKDLVKNFQAESGVPVTSLVVNDLGVAQPLHISLSRSLQVPTADRAGLLKAIVEAINSSGPYVFHVMPCGLKWVSNYDGTRSFLALALERPEHDELNQLLRLCNKTVTSRDFPPLYAQDADSDSDFSDFFHFSLAWALSSDISPPSVEQALNKVWSSMADKQHKLRVPVEALCIKIGNAVHHISMYRGQIPQ